MAPSTARGRAGGPRRPHCRWCVGAVRNRYWKEGIHFGPLQWWMYYGGSREPPTGATVCMATWRRAECVAHNPSPAPTPFCVWPPERFALNERNQRALDVSLMAAVDVAAPRRNRSGSDRSVPVRSCVKHGRGTWGSHHRALGTSCSPAGSRVPSVVASHQQFVHTHHPSVLLPLPARRTLPPFQFPLADPSARLPLPVYERMCEDQAGMVAEDRRSAAAERLYLEHLQLQLLAAGAFQPFQPYFAPDGACKGVHVCMGVKAESV